MSDCITCHSCTTPATEYDSVREYISPNFNPGLRQIGGVAHPPHIVKCLGYGDNAPNFSVPKGSLNAHDEAKAIARAEAAAHAKAVAQSVGVEPFSLATFQKRRMIRCLAVVAFLFLVYYLMQGGQLKF